METSVIIPCWIIDNSLLSLTYQCVEAVRDTSDVELILIDNASTLGSDFMMSESDIYVKNSANIGFTKAVNQGIKLATKPYIVVGNNDVIVSKGWEEELKKVLDRIDSCGAVLPDMDNNPVDDILYPEGVTGAWWMTTKNVLSRVGVLDERFFNRFSDLDFVTRLNNSHMDCLRTTKAKVEHKKSQSLGKLSHINNENEYVESRNKYLVKWRHNPDVRKRLADVMGEEMVNEFFKSVEHIT